MRKFIDVLRSPFVPPILFVGIWLLGIWGFQWSRQPRDLVDSAYRSIQMFGFNFEMEWWWQISWPLQAARFLAALFTVLAVVALFARRLFGHVWFWWQFRPTAGRQVLLGFGTVNHALARALRAQPGSGPILAIDKEFDEADRKVARAEDILLVTGELTAQETLDGARLRWSQAVYVACGDEAANIEIATAAARAIDEAAGRKRARWRVRVRRSWGRAFKRLPPRPIPKVFAHLSSVRGVTDLKESRDVAFVTGRRFQPFSLRIDAARDLLARARLTQRARDRGQDRVHLVLMGVGEQGEALFTEALLNAYADRLGPPKITFIDRDADAARARVTALYPHLFDETIPEEARPDLKGWIAADVATLCFEGDARLATLHYCNDPPTAWIFASGSDTVNLDAGLRLERAMQSLRQQPAPIYLRLWGARIDGKAPPEEPLRFFRTFGDIRTTAARADVLDGDADKLAKWLHSYYFVIAAEWDKNQPQPWPSARDYLSSWADLPENVRESNRRAARHALVKLADLGLQWRGMKDGKLPRVDKGFARKFQEAAEKKRFVEDKERFGEGSPEAQLLTAAQTEHKRWMADRAMSGWQAGPPERKNDGSTEPKRENRRRWHDQMKSFGDLKEGIRAFDVMLVRAALDYLSGEGGKGRPYALQRYELEIGLGDADGPVPAADSVGNHVTELVLTVDAEIRAVGDVRAKAIRELAKAWARRDAAMRIQVRTGQLLSAPSERSREHKDSQIAKFIHGLAEIAGPEILFDITPLYQADPPDN